MRSESKSATFTSWKEKILDYEIETMLIGTPISKSELSWKEKILDYEIETENMR